MPENSATKIDLYSIEPDEKNFYLIKWQCGDYSGVNHYHTNIIDIDYQTYMDCIKKCGMDEFEGI